MNTAQMRRDRLATFHTPETDRRLTRLLAGELGFELLSAMEDMADETDRMKRDGTWDEFCATGGFVA